ncbi:MAG: FAD-binding oxidoreductase [Candidatus Thiodiazotropha sp.]
MLIPGGTSHMQEKGFPRSVKATSEQDLLKLYSSDESDKSGVLPLGVAVPASCEEVQDVVRWAVKHRVPLIPISSKGPRQYGDTLSDTPSVVLDLTEMKGILNIDAADAVAIIEPGVTFEQLDVSLEPHGLRSFRPLFVRNSKSVLAAFLDRSPITVPGRHWDCSDPMAAMEIIFGSGDLFRTGTAALPGSLKKKLELGNSMMYGMGPAHTDFGRVMQGSQGTLGILTWASLHCQRIPTIETPYFISSNDLGSLTKFLYRHLRRRTEGQLFLMNGLQFKLLFGIELDSATVPSWVAYLELSSHDYFADEHMAFRKADLERDVKELQVEISEEIAGIDAADLPSIQKQHAFATPVGVSNQKYQDVFCLSQLNRLPQHIEALSRRQLDDAAIYVQPLVHGVNAHLQFTYLNKNTNGRSLQNASVEAAQCLADTGGFFSRPYYPWAHIPFERDTSIYSMLKKTKNLFDPAGILKPGSPALGGDL